METELVVCDIKIEGMKRRIKELETAAAELLEYAKWLQPHWESNCWVGKHPIDVMEKLLKRGA